MSFVYIQSEFSPGLWTVGFYTPDGKWISESDHSRKEDAARRVSWLNGGVILSPDERKQRHDLSLHGSNENLCPHEYPQTVRCARCGEL